MKLRVLFFLLAPLVLAGCETELYRNLSAREANEIVAVLLRAGIPASRTGDKVVGGGGGADKGGTLTVMVEDTRFADAVELLRSHGLPRTTHPVITDIFKGDGLVASPVEEKARYRYAIEESLAGTIAQIDGVLSSRVQIVLPETDALRRDPTPASASVFIRHSPQVDVGEVVPQIKMLVANAVAGLSYDKVSVVVVAAVEMKPAATQDASAIVPVLGLWVHRDSARAIEVVLLSGGALILALGGIAGWLGWRSRSSLLGRRVSGTSIALR